MHTLCSWHVCYYLVIRQVMINRFLRSLFYHKIWLHLLIKLFLNHFIYDFTSSFFTNQLPLNNSLHFSCPFFCSKTKVKLSFKKLAKPLKKFDGLRVWYITTYTLVRNHFTRDCLFFGRFCSLSTKWTLLIFLFFFKKFVFFSENCTMVVTCYNTTTVYFVQMNNK